MKNSVTYTRVLGYDELVMVRADCKADRLCDLFLASANPASHIRTHVNILSYQICKKNCVKTDIYFRHLRVHYVEMHELWWVMYRKLTVGRHQRRWSGLPCSLRLSISCDRASTTSSQGEP